MRAALRELSAARAAGASAAAPPTLFADGHAAAGRRGADARRTTCAQLSATTGLPHVLVRRNMEKIRGVLAGVEPACSPASRAASTSTSSTAACGEAARPRGELRPALADAGRRAAEQLAGRALAVGARRSR